MNENTSELVSRRSGLFAVMNPINGTSASTERNSVEMTQSEDQGKIRHSNNDDDEAKQKIVPSLDCIIALTRKHRSALQRFIVEFGVLLIVFLVTLFYYKSKKNVTLIPASECNTCAGTCDEIIALNQQSSLSFLTFNVAVKYQNSVGQTLTNYSYVQLSAEFTSCEINNPEPFMTNLGGNGSYFILPTTSDTAVSCSFNDTQKITVTIGPETSSGTVTTYPPSDCLSLQCSMAYAAGRNIASSGTINVPLDINESSVVYGQFGGEILTSNTNSIAASCNAFIGGVLVPFFSASNVVQTSTVSECTAYTNNIVAVGIALSYALTVASVMRNMHYLSDIVKKRNNNKQSLSSHA